MSRRPNTTRVSSIPETITVINTNTGKGVKVEAVNMTDKSVTIFLANEKIILYKQGNSYVGSKFGMELTYTPL